MAQKKDPVSQIEIAKALGLSQSTVSLALRGNEQVSKKSRDLVARKAKELGYIPDPKMGALSSYRQATSVNRVTPILAWVTNFETKTGWKRGHNIKYYEGAKRRASELGFGLREIWLGDEQVSSKQLHKDLTNQGIRGLLFSAQATLDTAINFDFRAFSSVSIGYSGKTPTLHSIDSYAVGNIQQAIRKLRLRGYQRIGLATPDSIDSRTNGGYYGGFFSVEPEQGGDAIPPFMHEPFDDAVFERWFKRWQPDAVIAWGNRLIKVENWLKNQGIEVGREIAIAGLDLEKDEGKYAGIVQQSELIGEVAVGTLVSYLNQFEYGLPDYGYQTLIDGRWIDGESAPGTTHCKR